MKLINFLPYSILEKKYLKSGASFGNAVSYLYMGECVEFKENLEKWQTWEQEYSRRGYRTINLHKFVEFGGYGLNIDYLIGQKRKENEQPLLHAEIYKTKYLGKTKPAADIGKLVDGEIQSGNYELPSTEQDQ